MTTKRLGRVSLASGSGSVSFVVDGNAHHRVFMARFSRVDYFTSNAGLRPKMKLNSTMTRATISRTRSSPPIVVPVTSPTAHNTNNIKAIVHIIFLSVHFGTVVSVCCAKAVLAQTRQEMQFKMGIPQNP